VYRPDHTVHIKGILRHEEHDALVLPSERSATLRVSGPDNKVVFNKELPVSAHGTVTADFDLATDATLGYYSIDFNGIIGAGSGSFYVEEYKKPEYQVMVKPAAQRALQGNTIQVVIEARYFFGKPVAGAKVTYAVHTTTHWWWDEGEEDENSEGGDAEAESSDESEDAWAETEQEEHQGVLDANGRLSITVPTEIDSKRNDQDYRIEARVTDAAYREVSGHSTVLATYGSFRVSVEPTNYLFESRKPALVKVTAQDYDSKPVYTQVHVGVVQTWDSATHERSATSVASKDVAKGADGSVLVELPLPGSGDFQITAGAETPGDARWRASPGSGSGTA
jgi:uncharacterized protein YfaS (alpha-2-macroglobulin family)